MKPDDLREVLRREKAQKRENTLCTSSLGSALPAQKIRKALKTPLFSGSYSFQGVQSLLEIHRHRP